MSKKTKQEQIAAYERLKEQKIRLGLYVNAQQVQEEIDKIKKKL